MKCLNVYKSIDSAREGGRLTLLLGVSSESNSIVLDFASRHDYKFDILAFFTTFFLAESYR